MAEVSALYQLTAIPHGWSPYKAAFPAITNTIYHNSILQELFPQLEELARTGDHGVGDMLCEIFTAGVHRSSSSQAATLTLSLQLAKSFLTQQTVISRALSLISAVLSTAFEVLAGPVLLSLHKSAIERLHKPALAAEFTAALHRKQLLGGLSLSNRCRLEFR